MSRVLALAATACLSAAPFVVPPAAHAGVVSVPGAFSYTTPSGWIVKPFPGMKYNICYAKPVAGFAPNIVAVDEAVPLPLAAYAKANLTQLQSRYPGFHFLGQSSFTTRTGLHGVKLLAEASPAGRKVRQAFYLFAGHGSQKWIVTGSTPASEGAKYDRALDASMKSFALK